MNVKNWQTVCLFFNLTRKLYFYWVKNKIKKSLGKLKTQLWKLVNKLLKTMHTIFTTCPFLFLLPLLILVFNLRHLIKILEYLVCLYLPINSVCCNCTVFKGAIFLNTPNLQNFVCETSVDIKVTKQTKYTLAKISMTAIRYTSSISM